MKTLFIIRHAKSSWDNDQLSDYDRPLNKRGLRDAPFMATLLRDQGIKPELILASPSMRTSQTTEFFAQIMGIDSDLIKYDPLIYESDTHTLLNIINQIENSKSVVFLVGHNPSLSNLASLLTGTAIILPTCGIASITFPVDSWSCISSNLGSLSNFDYPKKHH